MRKPIFAGNWKMNYTLRESKEYFEKFLKLLLDIDLSDREVVIAPPYTALYYVSQLIKDTGVILASQNSHFAEKGAFTGEISPLMLKEIGVKYVILGHSERRQIFGEDDELIKRRVEGVYTFGLNPILCVGETLEQREKGETFSIVEKQVREGLSFLKDPDPERIVVAYEPVWAIGTGRNATPSQAEEVQGVIRGVLAGLYGKERAEKIRILYGGSVTPENVQDLIKEPNIDGVLVGGASLDPEKFFKICTVELKKQNTQCKLPDYSQIPEDIFEIPKKFKKLVIVGASPKPDRPSYVVMDYLLREGFEVYPVNPAHKEILGREVYSNLESLPEDLHPEVVIIFRRSEEVKPVVEKALRLKPKVIWMQEGIVNEEAKALAESKGVKVVMNLCFKKVHQLIKWNS
ncbi:MAG: triose-phosphate isomerase [Caldimicrobium sp.]